MGKRVKRARLLTLVFTFGALWIAFVMRPTADQPLAWSLPWLPPLAATVLLMGVLFLAGLMVRSDRELGALAASRKPAMTGQMLVAALLIVGALLALVHSLTAALWGGPAWQRWAIVGLVTVTTIAGSGRAIGWALVGGLLGGALGFYTAFGREPTEAVDLFLTGIFVWLTIGAVAGTIWRGVRLRRDGERD